MGAHNAGRRPRSRPQVAQAELAWHEEQAQARRSLDALLYDPPAFDALTADGFAHLRPVAGQRLLEIGCGEGKETLALAGRGLRLIASDLSPAQLERARRRLAAALPGAAVQFLQANGEELPFGPGAFELVYAKAVLHHIDLAQAAEEIFRLLRPGGRAAVAEPLAHHPLFWLARRLTPGWRSQDEHPLTYAELARFGRRFPASEVRAYFLFAPLAYPLRALAGGEGLFRWLHARLGRLDRWLLRRWPALGRLAWYGAVLISK
ncbi:MAG: class I SAM-dependent methyltransferase [Candidatus Promineifilaceae bacterium]